MGKKRAKKESNNFNQEPENDSAQDDSARANSNGLGINAQQVGATLVGVLITEIVEAVAAQLIQKLTQPGNSAGQGLGERQKADENKPSTVENIRLDLGDRLKEVAPAVTDSASFARSTMATVAPSVNDVVAILKDVGQRLKQKSVDALDNSPEGILESFARSAISSLTPETAPISSVAKPKKKGKNKKKKHKK